MDLTFSITMVVWAAVGGRSSILGACIGAILINMISATVSETEGFGRSMEGHHRADLRARRAVLPRGFAGLAHDLIDRLLTRRKAPSRQRSRGVRCLATGGVSEMAADRAYDRRAWGRLRRVQGGRQRVVDGGRGRTARPARRQRRRQDDLDGPGLRQDQEHRGPGLPARHRHHQLGRAQNRARRRRAQVSDSERVQGSVGTPQSRSCELPQSRRARQSALRLRQQARTDVDRRA